MKKKLLTLGLVLALLLPAGLAAGGRTIEVYPINVQVNGQVFQPKDANGNPVEVFNYNGTTYAPLRALAEAYGLEVGWDQEKNLASVTAPVCEVDEFGRIPAETGARQLSDEQIRALAGKRPQEVAGSIHTLADAYAWLAQEGYSTGGMNGGAAGALENYNDRGEKCLSWGAMSTVLNILLEGDYDEVGTLLCIAAPQEKGWEFFYITFNYVKTGGIYYITDPTDHLENTGAAVYQIHTAKVSDLSMARRALTSNLGSGPSSLVALFSYPLNYTVRLRFKTDAQGYPEAFPDGEEGKLLYRATEEEKAEYEQRQEEARKAEMERWQMRASAIRVSAWKIPVEIGKQTLTYDEALELVGQDPALIAEQVKSVADVLQYMIAARFGYDAPGAFTPWYDNGWGFDAPGDEQLRQNYGCCCGGYANTVSYLLKGDYEKVGTLRWIGGGNHTISWVYTGGKYYVFDFTQYCDGGNYNNLSSPVTVLDRLEDFYDQMPDVYSFFPKSEVVIMVAFEAGDAMYPSQWEDPPQFTGLTLPQEAEGKVTVIYQKDPAYGVKYAPVIGPVPGWNS